MKGIIGSFGRKIAFREKLHRQILDRFINCYTDLSADHDRAAAEETPN